MKQSIYLFSIIMASAWCMYGCSDDSEITETQKEQKYTLQVKEKTVAEEAEEVKYNLLEDGKIWIVGHYSYFPIYGEIFAHTKLEIEGDTVCNGKEYKKVMSTDLSKDKHSNLLTMIREDNGIIYRLEPHAEKETVDFDCNMQAGDTCPQGYKLSDIIFDQTGNTSMNRMFIFNNNGEELFRYIEGIGFTCGAFMFPLPYDGSGVTLECCHQKDGTCIYEQTENHKCVLSFPDFENGQTTGIVSVFQ